MAQTIDTIDDEDEMTCCVCMETMEEDDLRIFWDDETVTVKGLSQLVDEEVDMIRDGTKVLLKSICGRHFICSFCLHYLATSFGSNHPIGPRHPMIRCPYPFEECLTPATAMPNYFPHALIEVLLDSQELELYRAHCQRYQFPGYELVECPRPSRFGTTCGAGILVPMEEIEQAEMGRLIIRCDQNPSCRRKTCYHCRNLIHRSRTWCDYCLTSTENEQSDGLNHYFYRPGKRMSDGLPNLWRNNEITVELAVQQIMEIIEAERMEVKCTNCLTLMFKTEKCNALKHCGIERCYSCGRSGTRHRKLGDHWDSSGIRGCPRFDASIYWNVIARCDFRCIEGECYGDELGDCTIEEHQPGIEAMIRHRKKAHIYHAILSLLPETRKAVIETLGKRRGIREWLPEWWSTDYHTYFSDTVKRIVDHPGMIPSAMKEKLENVSFEPIEYPDEVEELTSGWEQPRYEDMFVKFRERYGRRLKRRA